MANSRIVNTTKHDKLGVRQLKEFTAAAAFIKEVKITMWDITPKTIRGNRIQLEPLHERLFDSLCECLLNDPQGWFSRMYNFDSPEAIKKLIDGWTKANVERRAMSFVARDLASNNVAGISQFMRIEEKNKQLEIGGTIVGRRFRRTYVNTEMKYLMLTDAFERLGAVRTYFKADTENIKSQDALVRIGANYEGTARNDAILHDGRKRDYQIYSVTDEDWLRVKNHLEFLLSKP